MTQTETNMALIVEQSRSGDRAATNALITHSMERLYTLTKRMLYQFPRLHRWEATDDVFQNSMIRLQKSLTQLQVSSTQHFFNLAALHIRRELLDLNRKHFGKYGMALRHDSTNVYRKGLQDRPPRMLGEWLRFHETIDTLEQDEQEIVNILYYQGMNQEDAANLLGVSSRTLKRKWQAVRCKLYGVLREEE